jgi:putative FmdB family regulatory protein
MPLYEYECRACGQHFEYLTRAGQSPACPGCDSRDLQKLLSVFAVNTSPAQSQTSFGASPCGSCGDPRGPGSCSLN